MAAVLLLDNERAKMSLTNLLIHSIDYSEPAGRTRDGKTTYTTPVTVSAVRVAPVLETAKSDTGESKNDRLTLYVFCGISTPETVPLELAKVVFNGKDYTIRAVTVCYAQDGTTPHHYEAALV